MATHWADIQTMVFGRWVNVNLQKRGMHVEKLSDGLGSGLELINLLEIITEKSLPRYNKHPVIPMQRLENCSIAIKWLTETEKVKLVNISGDDINAGRIKLILGLIWTLILKYDIGKGTGADDDSSARNDLLEWVRSKIPEYNIQNFKKDWNDGRAINALVNALKPGACLGHRSLDASKGEANCAAGIDLGFTALGVPKLIMGDEMANPRVDEHSVMAYIQQYRHLAPMSGAACCSAYGKGLVEAIAKEPASFHVVNPTKAGKLEIKVKGPSDSAAVKVTPQADGVTFAVEYEPKTPGDYEVSITLDGVHIPGSVFKVSVLDEINLGGAGKIRVFYSTTSSTAKTNRPLMDLFEAKKIHLRPDFEPWLPVDLLTREDREAVFKKAGTRELPIIYVDDKYVGNDEEMFRLNEQGLLDKTLKMK